MRIGEWYFNTVRVKAIKTPEFGKPYTAIGDIVIADGQAHVEGLLSNEKEKLGSADRASLNEFLTHLGYTKYTCSHFEDGERIITEIEIK